MKKYDYDLVVIGGGAAGIAGAMMAVANNKRVALIEKEIIGGKNTVGNFFAQLTASKISQLLNLAREGASFGLNSDNLKVNLPSMYSEIQEKTEQYVRDKKKELLEAKIELIHGTARFISPVEVAVNDQTITAKKFLIATGTSLNTREIAGINETGFLNTSEIYLNLRRVPKVTLVVGAGQAGVEAAEFLANLGGSVILVDLADRILPREDPEVGKLIEKKFAQKKIKILTQTRVVGLENDGAAKLPTGRKMNIIRASLLRAEQKKAVRVECVVLATGQQSEVDLALENANVKYTKSGILVSNQMQTSSKNIFAAGGAAMIRDEKKIFHDDFSSYEKDSYEGALAVSMALNGRSKTIVDHRGYMRITNTYPKIASIGLTEDQCVASGLKCRVAITDLSDRTAAWSSNSMEGFVKIICNREKKIIGATVVAPEADVLAQEISLAMRNGLSVVDLAATPHVGMSLSEAVRVTARKLL